MTRVPRGATQFKWRRQRQQDSRGRPTLNLIALMDVFTILVFFFLVHSTEGSPQSRGELVNLPESIADQQPRDTPVVTISTQTIYLEGQPVVAVATIVQADDEKIEALALALQALLDPETAAESAAASADAVRELTIMGDKSIPFALLKRVMRTCTLAGFGNIALSVQQRATGAG